jgi:hypothetical protein
MLQLCMYLERCINIFFIILVPIRYVGAARNNKLMKTCTFILTVKIRLERNCCVHKKDMSGKKRMCGSPGMGPYDSSCAY